jgi:hypothetical protein
MSIKRLIESIGLTAPELKQYLLAELEEFLLAQSPEDKEEEFGDLLLALTAMVWAHAGKHYSFTSDAFEPKIKARLLRYAALSRNPARFHHDRIPEIEIGVIHFAFGHFAGQWSKFDSLKNGTVAEIHLLTSAPFFNSEQFTNHCIITFDEVEAIEFSVLDSSPLVENGNCVLCRIPDFLYKQAKWTHNFYDFKDYLALQVMAALHHIKLAPEAISHFHSWECGFLTESAEFREYVEPLKTIFSPYLTVARLRVLVENMGGENWTMTQQELKLGVDYEEKLCAFTSEVVLESESDKRFYQQWVGQDKIRMYNFGLQPAAVYESAPDDQRQLSFITGGRPVREKGFVELCREFSAIRDWANKHGLAVRLAILCRERSSEKGAAYIAEIEKTISDYGLDQVVTVEQKVSLDVLKRRISQSSAVLVPSLFDPFCLLPTYAVEAKRPAFVSCYAGVAENVVNPTFVFSPNEAGSLLAAVKNWYESTPAFEYASLYPSYENIYLNR